MNIEQALYSAVYESAKNILQGNGYETDLGKALRDWKNAVVPRESEAVFEIRDVGGSASEEQYPFQHETINYEFVIAARYGADTASFLRSARADIYRMIENNIDDWRKAVGNASLKPTRAGFSRDIRTEERIIGELTMTIEFTYEQEYYNPNI